MEDEDGFIIDEDGFEEGPPLPGSAELPSGYRETGARVHVLPGMSFSPGRTEFAEGEGHTEALIEKAPSAHDVPTGTRVGTDRRPAWERGADAALEVATNRALDPTGGLVPLVTGLSGQRGGVAGAVGREPPTVASLRRALSSYQRAQGVGAGIDEALRAAMPTAPMPPGEDTGTDRRPQAVWRALGGAALFGQADELGAALGGGEGETYAARRDALRAEAEQSRAQSPAGETLGQIAGSAPLAMLPGGQSTALARVGTQAAYGAGLGALRGAGESEATDASGVLLDVGLGAGVEGLTGGVLAGGGEAVGGALRRLAAPSGVLSRAADEARMTASGLNPNPGPGLSFGRSAYGRSVERMGGQQGVAAALDAERVGGRLPTPQATADSAARIAADAGGEFQGVMDQMEQAGAGVPVSQYMARLEGIARRIEETPTASAQRAAERLRSEFIEPLRAQASAAPDGYRGGSGTMPFARAHQLRQTLDEMSGVWRRAADPAENSLAGIAAEARGELSQMMDDAAAGVAPELREQWRRANRRWQLVALLRDNARESGSRLPGAIAEGVNLAEGDLLRASASRAAGHMVSRFGPGLRARGLQGIVRALRAGDAVAQRYAQILERAGAGGVGLPAAHFLLMRTRPDYRALIERGDAAQTGDQP